MTWTARDASTNRYSTWCRRFRRRALNFGTFELALHILSPGHVDEAPRPHAGLNLEVDRIEALQALIEGSGGEMIELRGPSATFRIASRRFATQKATDSNCGNTWGSRVMGEVLRSGNCGNSPKKNALLERLATIAKRDAKAVRACVTDDAHWNVVGKDPIAGKDRIAAALERRADDVAAITISHVVSPAKPER